MTPVQAATIPMLLTHKVSLEQFRTTLLAYSRMFAHSELL
jgi:hypothetical protein